MNKDIKVYYNGACPVCNAEISGQQNKNMDCKVQWIDIDKDVSARKDIDKDIEGLREKLHIIDENGQVKVGMEALTVMWQHTLKDKWKARITNFPVIKQILKVVYNIIAHLLYKWNKAKNHW